jgi:hypothetical protein
MFSDVMLPQMMDSAQITAEDPDLVRCGLDRPGALLAGDDPEGSGA